MVQMAHTQSAGSRSRSGLRSDLVRHMLLESRQTEGSGSFPLRWLLDPGISTIH